MGAAEDNDRPQRLLAFRLIVGDQYVVAAAFAVIRQNSDALLLQIALDKAGEIVVAHIDPQGFVMQPVEQRRRRVLAR